MINFNFQRQLYKPHNQNEEILLCLIISQYLVKTISFD
jgi:hypothetical protein